MAIESVAKQGAKTLAAQLRGVFAGLDALPAWVDELAARDEALAEREAAIPSLQKERDNLTREIADLTGRRTGEVAKSKQAVETGIAATRSASESELHALAARLDAAREQAENVERESAARIAEATAKVGVVETALRETSAQYEAVQKDYNALKAKLG
jgi:chromosome segregation ATPase